MKRKHSLLVLATFVGFFCLAINEVRASWPASRIDETESLALLVKALSSTDTPGVQASLLKGMLSGLEGRRNVAAPVGWVETNEKLGNSNDPAVRALCSQLAQIFGDLEAMRKSLAVLKDTSADPNKRKTALRTLLMMRSEEAASHLESLLEEPEMRMAAIRGFAAIETPTAPAVMLERYKELDPEHQRAVVETLATRKRYAEVLLVAIKNKQVSRQDIPVQVARTLKILLGRRFVNIYGEIKSLAADRENQLNKYKALLTPEALAKADPAHGRAVFKKTCAACHLLYGDGGKVGPDLTGSNRANLDYILLNSVDPSYDVPSGYKMVTVVTVDGRLINGVVAEEDGTKLVLKTAEQPRVVIAKADIEERKISDKSIMPDGQLDQMKPREVIDLIKYLRTTEQVEMKQ